MIWYATWSLDSQLLEVNVIQGPALSFSRLELPWEILSERLLLNQKTGKPVKVENKVFARGIKVLDQRVHASELAGLLKDHYTVRKRFAFESSFQALQRCTMVCRLFHQLSLYVLSHHSFTVLAIFGLLDTTSTYSWRLDSQFL